MGGRDYPSFVSHTQLPYTVCSSCAHRRIVGLEYYMQSIDRGSIVVVVVVKVRKVYTAAPAAVARR
eukprot:scaffold23617_cov47-Attheya_sp.AAC.1